jgi:geranylgeranyl diphosphate synthase type II
VFEDKIFKIESKLKKYISNLKDSEEDLFESMCYSLLIGGKRIRSVLSLEFCSACNGDEDFAIPFACALEMVHTYSLIHDDLPCMDDSHLRRGKPSNHVVFGEATALLAGDALLTLAFDVLTSNLSYSKQENIKILKCVNILSTCAGANGMIGGQSIDLKYENKKIDIKTLQKMHEMKTGKLILAAARGGCILAGASNSQVLAAEKYAKNLGLAFQITDDILDVNSSELKLGKPTGIDEKKTKPTYVTLLGICKSKEFVEKLTDDAISSLENFEGNTENLKRLALNLSKRSY